MKPKLSIVLTTPEPSSTGKTLLAKTLASLAGQSDRRFEVICYGHMDEAEALCREFGFIHVDVETDQRSKR